MKAEILKHCAELFDVPVRDIMSRRRIAPVMHARWALYTALRQRGWSYPAIGRFTGRHHTTVMAGVREGELRAHFFPAYADKIRQIVELGANDV